MDVGTRVDYFRKEHRDFLRLLDDWEDALEFADSCDEQECVRGLDWLRALQPDLQALHDHCTSEERNVEGPYRSYLQKGQIDTLRTDHEELARLLNDLFFELRFATLYQTQRAVTAGHHVAQFTRQHIQFEEKLLEEIEKKLARQAEEQLFLRYTQFPD